METTSDSSLPDIQRWDIGHEPMMGIGIVHKSGGKFITYADHCEALRQAEQAALQKGWGGGMKDANLAVASAYEQGQRDALAGKIVFTQDEWRDELARNQQVGILAAVQRVEALMHYPMNHTTECAWFKSLTSECDCLLSKVIAAIKDTGS
jgi:hypothetical protein